MSNNPNHPKQGTSTKVEPIHTKAAIERIKSVLRDQLNTSGGIIACLY